MERIEFTGAAILAFGREIAAKCIVRNEENGWRGPAQVVRTFGNTTPHGLAYQPRPFPPGEWNITTAYAKADSAETWPWFVATDAWQNLELWDLDERGRYLKPTGQTIVGRDYGAHYARYRTLTGLLVPSNTTLGCLNILDLGDARWFGSTVRSHLGLGTALKLIVPEWDQWEEA